jgi:DNA-binding LacI/PurR family transcriptional regulator/DNA-binding transcriptional regulator YhcF (GntR family)
MAKKILSPVNETKQEWLRLQILTDIQKRKLKAHESYETERALCELFSISRLTTRIVLKKLVSEGVIYQHHGKGTFIAPPHKSKRVILIVDPKTLAALDAQGHLMLFATRLIETFVLKKMPFHVTFLSSLEAVEQFQKSVTEMFSDIGAFIFFRTTMGIDSIFTHVAPLKIPVIFYGSDTYLPKINIPIPRYVYPEKKILSLAFSHLRARGHQRIGWTQYGDNEHFPAEVSANRKQILKNVLQEKGLELSLQEAVSLPSSSSSKEYERFHSELKTLAKKVSALICFDDTVAANVLKASHQLGIKVPNDLAVIGINGDFYGHFLQPSLTTILIPTSEDAHEIALSLNTSEALAAKTIFSRITLKKAESG